MSSHGTDRERTGESRPAGGYRAITERYRDEPDQCTIVPVGVGDAEKRTTWITAKSPWYVDLRLAR